MHPNGSRLDTQLTWGCFFKTASLQEFSKQLWKVRKVIITLHKTWTTQCKCKKPYQKKSTVHVKWNHFFYLHNEKLDNHSIHHLSVKLPLLAVQLEHSVRARTDAGVQQKQLCIFIGESWPIIFFLFLHHSDLVQVNIHPPSSQRAKAAHTPWTGYKSITHNIHSLILNSESPVDHTVMHVSEL